MNQKELTKTVMMISNLKNPLVPRIFKKKISVLRVYVDSSIDIGTSYLYYGVINPIPAKCSYSTLKTLNYFVKNSAAKGVFQFEIIINVLVDVSVKSISALYGLPPPPPLLRLTSW